MSETKVEAPAPVVEDLKNKVDVKNNVQLSVRRPKDQQTLLIYIKAPVVASVVRNMTMSNYDPTKYDPIYKPILMPHPQDPKRVVTRAAIAKATTNIVGGVDFSFAEPPRSILLANPDKLEEGYELVYKVEAPVPPDQIRRWGKQFMDGCADIITNARPFKMSWVMERTE